jgi:predicted transcriptional regulator
MKKQITYTSTLPDDLISRVNEYAEKYKVTKNKVIEEALRKFLFEARRKEFQAGFKKLANDPEILELAETGIEEWGEMLDKMDQENV